MNRPQSVSRDAGFTMIELLVVLLVALVLMMLSAPELMKYYIRSQLEGVTRQTSFILQKARFQAIKNSQEVEICADTAGRVVTGLGQTIELPDSVSFGAPASEDPTVTGDCFVFLADGSVKFMADGVVVEDEEPRPFRFADVRGNFLEVQVAPRATARVQVLKWNEEDNAWYTRDQGGKAWEWKTGNLL
jgi:prepilin-type N-terminal cleavage/methylation domain-containing protein